MNSCTEPELIDNENQMLLNVEPLLTVTEDRLHLLLTLQPPLN